MKPGSGYMAKLIRRFLGVDLFRISSINAISVFFRLIFSYATNKAVVMWLGPTGTALTEQLRNLVQGVQGVSTLGIGEAITRYTSLYRKRDKRLKAFLKRSGRLILYISIVLGLVIFFGAAPLSRMLFKTDEYVFVLRMVGLFTPVYAYQMLLNAMLNGLEQYKKIVYINIIFHAVGFLAMVMFILWRHMEGALLAVALTPVLAFLFSAVVLEPKDLRLLAAPLSNGAKGMNAFGKRIWPFIGMALTSAISIPLFTIMLRNNIIDYYGAEGMVYAGYWDAIRKISAFYFMFITPVFAMHYFPRISRLSDPRDWRREMTAMLKYLYPLFMGGFVLIYLLRRWITLFIFSGEYLPVNDLYGWQLTADAIRLLSLLLAYRMWAKGMTVRFVFAELSYWVFYLSLAHFFLQVRGLTGVMEALVWANAYYLILMLIYFGNLLKK